MKIILFVLLTLFSISALAVIVEDKTTFPPTTWTSKNTTDEVTINNGAGLALVININVNPGATGVTIKNCGTTTHINPGSSAVCSNSDPTSPVTMSSDSASVAASGTYQVKQQ